MKELIIEALEKAFNLLENQVPKTKKQCVEISIGDIRPIDIQQFMQANNIPRDATFGTWDDGDIFLRWEIDVPTTDSDRINFKRSRFSNTAFKFVYDSLVEKGYKRIPWDSYLGRQFAKTTPYDLYIEKDFDRITSYYSLFFAENTARQN